jgi:uncharacterized membrane protein YphA (DoxX/SURF4 family)
MNIALWILQVLLAALFLWHGALFAAPPPEMVEMMNAQVPPGLRVFIGVAELLAAVGLILPAATRILPQLTPLAAAGLAIVTASATVFHLTRGEGGSAGFAAIVCALVSVVAYARWKVRPIAPRLGPAAHERA